MEILQARGLKILSDHQIAAKIAQRERQILVHAYLYYK